MAKLNIELKVPTFLQTSDKIIQAKWRLIKAKKSHPRNRVGLDDPIRVRILSALNCRTNKVWHDHVETFHWTLSFENQSINKSGKKYISLNLQSFI